MPEMEIPELLVPVSLEDAVKVCMARLGGKLSPPMAASPFLIGYMAWPENEERRNSWTATLFARAKTKFPTERSPTFDVFEDFGGLGAIAEPAFQVLVAELPPIEKKWRPVADVYCRVVDMHDDERLSLRGGPSVSKAIDLCEYELEGRSRAQLYRHWHDFHRVGYLIAAGALLAEQVSTSIFIVSWLAPDAVLSVAAGFEDFGLSLKSHSRVEKLISYDTAWLLPAHSRLTKPYLAKRRLSEQQIAFLNHRIARKPYSSKPKRSTQE